MKTTELRVGNLILDTFSLQSKEVVSLTLDDFQAMNNFKRSGIDNTYRPIPLTKEWLIKFGFENLDYICPETSLVYSDDEFVLSICKYSKIVIQSDFSFGIEDSNRNDCIAFENDYICSVHQLQNLYFALTNKELTYENI